VSKQAFFAQQLARWLYTAEWHFTTLLGITVECTQHLPDDCDALINELLQRYPAKPSQTEISEFLRASARLANWFHHELNNPTLTRVTIEQPVSDAQAAEQLINKQLPIIATVGDLAHWLSLTMPQLDWLANLWRHDTSTPDHLKHYQYELLEKRDGGMRLIEKPKARLKQIQRKIYQHILTSADIHPAAHGFYKGKNCLSHASNHVGKRYLMLYDITDCFHSISWPAVKSVFIRLGYSQEVSTYLTALCTHRVQLDTKTLQQFNRAQQARLKQRHLPQGAPSSPMLVNAVLHRLDLRLTGLANKLDIDYSRYADDIAMSSNTHRDWRFLEPLVGSICLDEGVTLNYRKTRIKRRHQKQRLVGVVVNNKPNVDRAYFDALKATLTNITHTYWGVSNT